MSFICHIPNYTEYNQLWNVFSAFDPSKCTHTWSRAADTAASGEQLGVRCLAQGSHLSRGQFLPEPRFEPTTSGYKSDALSIRATTSPMKLGLNQFIQLTKKYVITLQPEADVTANVVCLLTAVMWLVSLRTVQTTQESKGQQNVLVKASFVATVREGERECVCVCVCVCVSFTGSHCCFHCYTNQARGVWTPEQVTLYKR